ncbi:MAG: F0F1 ATP synthase subunit delta [Paracoccaceae bacterium]|nr:F0F1 ATP synthase subunit delta [Marinovum sp.]MDG1424741.1 F0F1 ATP synthase subunit delta [Paracoccaceae bacterium]MDG2231120.1 F0F1 ATP synthase subunit delta [Paracoccaceae bacterium]
MSEPASISSGIAARYATAVFELAKDASDLKKLESNIDDVRAALADSEDFRVLISSPLYSREDQSNAIAGIAAKMKLMPMLASTFGLMASKRRLFVLPQLLDRLHDLIAEDKGEVTAEVISAKAMTKTQSDKLAAAIKSRIGKNVKIDASVDQELIGGLVVKVGSKMIDTSIRSKLNSLQNVMKEVG